MDVSYRRLQRSAECADSVMRDECGELTRYRLRDGIETAFMGLLGRSAPNAVFPRRVVCAMQEHLSESTIFMLEHSYCFI
jgi:hypothetical protein